MVHGTSTITSSPLPRQQSNSNWGGGWGCEDDDDHCASSTQHVCPLDLHIMLGQYRILASPSSSTTSPTTRLLYGSTAIENCPRILYLPSFNRPWTWNLKRWFCLFLHQSIGPLLRNEWREFIMFILEPHGSKVNETLLSLLPMYVWTILRS